MVWIDYPAKIPDWREVLERQIEEAVKDDHHLVELHLYPAEGAGVFAVSAPPRATLFRHPKMRMADRGYAFVADEKDVIGWILTFRRAEQG